LIKKFFYRDSMLLGIAIGAVLPLIVYYLFDLLNVYVSDAVFHKPVIISKTTAELIALFANVLVFRFYMISVEMDYTGRGILLSTFIYAFVFCYINKAVLF
jgi:hypothetical protein